MKTESYSGKPDLKRIKSDSNYRTALTVTFSSWWNFAYAMYHLVLAYMYRSYWFLTMGIYYLTACLMKSLALRSDQRKGNAMLKRNGLLMFLLAVVFSGIVCLTVAGKRNSEKSLITALVIAAYTFFLVIKAIVNIVNRNRRQTVQMIVIRNISLAFSFGSLYGLERMMLSTFGNSRDMFSLTLEMVSGAVIFALIVLLGINSLILSYETDKVGVKRETQDSDNPC